MRPLPGDGAGVRQGRRGAGAGVRLAKIDTEAHSEVSARFGIRGIPLLITFQGGREVARQAGAQPATGMERWVRSVAAERV